MKLSQMHMATLLGATLLSLSPLTANALAVERQSKAVSVLEPRKDLPITGFAAIILAVKDYLQDKEAYAPSVPDKCVLTMSTTAGHNCEAFINCDTNDDLGKAVKPVPGDPKNPNSLEWNVCKKGGRQYFKHDALGDFSITFSEASNGQLDHPILQFANIGNNDPLKVQDIADQQKSDSYNGEEGGHLCGWTQIIVGDMAWKCGIPTKAKAGSYFGISQDTQTHQSTYAPGWCVMSITQFQRPKPTDQDPKPQYAFSITISDKDKKVVGQVTKKLIDAKTKTLEMTSNLPAVMVVSVGEKDPDKPWIPEDNYDERMLDFKYNGDHWVSGDAKHCDQEGWQKDGGYKDGHREMKCGFTCK